MSKNLCDVFGQEARYVILKKANRVQVFEKPSDKSLRKKSKKGWTLVDWATKNETHLTAIKILEIYYNPFNKEIA